MTTTEAATGAEPPKKLHGRAFYESIGSPKFIVAPMVDQSEFVCLARSPNGVCAGLTWVLSRPGECSHDPSCCPRSSLSF